MQRVVVDSAIPFIEGVLEPYFEVSYVAGSRICHQAIKDAVALVVRTRTLCNKELLEGTAVRAIFTATIGLDHIDQEYCTENGIKVYSAQGCNARAVAQWVFSAIKALRGDMNFTLGIVGVGNVGGEVLGIARSLGVKTILCDPPRMARGESGFSSLEEVLRISDIVTLHTPLDRTTRGMVDGEFLAKMKHGAVLLNSSRGEVVVEGAVLEDSVHSFVFDVWSGEPDISLDLLGRTTFATPHIAGYSARGKARGTTFTVQSIGREFGVEALEGWDCSVHYPLEDPFGFDIVGVDSALRADPGGFELLRVVRDIL